MRSSAAFMTLPESFRPPTSREKVRIRQTAALNPSGLAELASW